MTILQIPITKAGKGVYIEVDTDELQSVDAASEVMLDLLARGLKDALNSRMGTGFASGSTLATKHGADSKEVEDNKAACLDKAKENLSDLMAGKLTKKAKAPTAEKREVITAARRLAREIVKNTIREKGGKPSHYAPSEITKWADVLIADDPSYVEDAKAELERLAKTASKPMKTIMDIKPDPKKVAKAKAEADSRKTQLSATQAGLSAKGNAGRGKGKVPLAKGSMPAAVMTANQAEAHTRSLN